MRLFKRPHLLKAYHLILMNQPKMRIIIQIQEMLLHKYTLIMRLRILDHLVSEIIIFKFWNIVNHILKSQLYL